MCKGSEWTCKSLRANLCEKFKEEKEGETGQCLHEDKNPESNKCLLVVLQEKTSPVSVCETQVGEIISYVRKGKKWAKRRRKKVRKEATASDEKETVLNGFR